MRCRRRPGLVNGQSVTTRDDSGCDVTLVRSTFVESSSCDGEMRELIVADGRKVTVPMAQVYLEVTRLNKLGNSVPLTGYFRVGVMDGLPEEVLLGNDILDEPSAALVVTRGQAKARQQCDDRAQQAHQDLEVRPKAVKRQSDVSEQPDVPKGECLDSRERSSEQVEDIQRLFLETDSDGTNTPETGSCVNPVEPVGEVVMERNMGSPKANCRDNFDISDAKMGQESAREDDSPDCRQNEFCRLSLEDICKLGPEELKQ